jgi:hypothetical protein
MFTALVSMTRAVSFTQKDSLPTQSEHHIREIPLCPKVWFRAQSFGILEDEAYPMIATRQVKDESYS